jgi:soluble lytic murein transglycosylase-like protein
MSTLAIGATEAGAREAAPAGRVQQIQALIAEVEAAANGAAALPTQGASAPAGNFASALQAASAQAAPNANASSLSASSASGSEGGQYDGLIAQAAQRNGLDPAILHGLIQQESGFNPGSQSSAGAMGLTQLMPGTASSLGVSNPLDPSESVEGGARYLAGLMKEFGGNSTEALAAYNAGPGAVKQYGGVPPYSETQDYVTKVLGYAEAYRRSHPTTTLTGAIA